MSNTIDPKKAAETKVPANAEPKAAIPALGGAPIKFAPISSPTGPGGESPAPATPAKHDPLFDGPSAEVVAARQLLTDLAAALKPMRGAVTAHLPQAVAKLTAIKASPLALDEAKSADIDLIAAANLIKGIYAAFGIDA